MIFHHKVWGNFEVFLYSNVLCPDEMTHYYQNLVGPEHWRSTVGLHADQVARQIQQDGINILVDCTGHTSFNRLDVK